METTTTASATTSSTTTTSTAIVRELLEELVDNMIQQTGVSSSPSSPTRTTSTDILMPLLSKLRDPNDSILQKRGTVFTMALEQPLKRTIAIEAVSSNPKISILHLYVLLWMVSIQERHQLQPSWWSTLKEHIGLIVSSGGDAELPMTGADIYSYEHQDYFGDGQNKAYILRYNQDRAMTPNESVFLFIKAKPSRYYTYSLPSSNDSDNASMDFNHETKEILDMIQTAKAVRPFSSSEFSQSVTQAWSNLSSSLSLQQEDEVSSNSGDVTFVCKDRTTTYSAHQIVLSGVSPYFQRHFGSPAWMDNNPNRQWKTDISPTVLKMVLRFIYTGRFATASNMAPSALRPEASDVSIAASSSIALDTIVEVLQVAQEFEMSALVEACCKIIRPRLSQENIKQMTIVAASISAEMTGPTNLWECCADFMRESNAAVTALSSCRSMVAASATDKLSPPRMAGSGNPRMAGSGNSEQYGNGTFWGYFSFGKSKKKLNCRADMDAAGGITMTCPDECPSLHVPDCSPRKRSREETA